MGFRVFIPCDFLRNSSSLEQKTLLTGSLARYCTIFNVDEIIIYDTGQAWKQKGFDTALLQEILFFLSIPQYLRKIMFPKSKTLIHVGLLPPLATPDHPVGSSLDKAISSDSPIYRKALVIERKGGCVVVEAGFDNPVTVQKPKTLDVGNLINISIEMEGNHYSSREIDRSTVPFYWGYQVQVETKPFMDVVECAREGSVTVATSKHGQDVNEVITNGIGSFSLDKNRLSLFFGPRETGLSHFFPSMDAFLAAFDLVLNVFPDATNRSIRLEEAIFSTLALVGVLLRKKNG